MVEETSKVWWKSKTIVAAICYGSINVLSAVQGIIETGEIDGKALVGAIACGRYCLWAYSGF